MTSELRLVLVHVHAQFVKLILDDDEYDVEADTREAPVDNIFTTPADDKPVVIHQQTTFFMEVHQPTSLKYTFEIMMARDIGRPFARKLEHVQLTYAHPEDACTPIVNSVKATVVLVERG